MNDHAGSQAPGVKLAGYLSAAHRDTGGDGIAWRDSTLPQPLCEPVARVSRCLHGLSGVTRVLHAGLLSHVEGDTALTPYDLDQLACAARTLVDYAFESLEIIAERYPERPASENKP